MPEHGWLAKTNKQENKLDETYNRMHSTIPGSSTHLEQPQQRSGPILVKYNAAAGKGCLVGSGDRCLAAKLTVECGIAEAQSPRGQSDLRRMTITRRDGEREILDGNEISLLTAVHRWVIPSW